MEVVAMGSMTTFFSPSLGDSSSRFLVKQLELIYNSQGHQCPFLLNIMETVSNSCCDPFHSRHASVSISSLLPSDYGIKQNNNMKNQD